VPKNHPLAAQYGGGTAATPTAPGATTPTYGTSGSIPGQAGNASTYSTTPGAAPLPNTTNQGTQDVVRNSYLDTIAKGTNVDRNDPMFRMQSDAFSAAQERQRRNAQDDLGEAAFAAGQRGVGGNLVEQRMIDETAARNVGQFEAGLVGQELQQRRDDIRNALSSLGGMIQGDQAAALQRELAALDAAIKRESLAQTGSLGTADLSLRDKLGTGALNVDLLRALLQNQQIGNQLGFDVSQFDWRRLMDAANLSR
jgi:hypothetical protein